MITVTLKHLNEINAKAERWDKLKTWLNNLMNLSSVNKTEKKGIQIALNVMNRIEEEDKPDYDETGETQYNDAMESGISKAERGYMHWSDEVENPDDPERPMTFMGKTGYLATCDTCGVVVLLCPNRYSSSDAENWTCDQSKDPELIEACKQKQAADDGTSDQAYDANRESQVGRSKGRD